MGVLALGLAGVVGGLIAGEHGAFQASAYQPTAEDLKVMDQVGAAQWSRQAVRWSLSPRALVDRGASMRVKLSMEN